MAPLLIAGIGAAANAAVQGFNANTQQSQNYTQWQRANNMYEWQRSDALADWHMQNNYNSPAAQMKRLQEAGLNPNLVYGNGATQQAAAIRSSSADIPQGRAPQYEGSFVSSQLGQMYDLELRQAQTENTQLNAKNIQMDALLKGAQIEATLANAANTKTKTDILARTGQVLADLNIAGMQAGITKTESQIEQIKQSTQFTLHADERAALSNAQSLAQGAETVLNLRAQRAQTAEQTKKIRQEIQNLQQDNLIRKLDEKLAAAGIRPGTRVFDNVMNQVLDPKSPTHQNIANILNSFDKYLPKWLQVNAR